MKIVFIESTSEFLMSVTFFFLSVNENIKCWYLFSLLDCKEHFGTNFITLVFFFRIFYFSDCEFLWFQCLKTETLTYATSLHVYMKSFVNVCDVKSADNRYVCQIVNNK